MLTAEQIAAIQQHGQDLGRAFVDTGGIDQLLAIDPLQFVYLRGSIYLGVNAANPISAATVVLTARGGVVDVLYLTAAFGVAAYEPGVRPDQVGVTVERTLGAKADEGNGGR